MKSPAQCLAVMFFLGVSLSAAGQTRKRIAVFQFVDRTTSNKDMNIGLKVADALVSKLAESGTFSVIDRDNLQRIMAERNMKFDENFNPVGAPQSGLMDVVDILVTGQVDEFNANQKTVESSNYISKKTEVDGEARLRVTARVISVQTGQILAAPSASVDKSAVLGKSTSTTLVQNLGNKSGTANVDAALRKLVDAAVDDTTDSLASKISSGPASKLAVAPIAPPVPASSAGPPRTIKAKFVGLDDGEVMINKGLSAGVKKGDKFSLVRVVATKMKDPDTGKPIVRHKQVCDLVVDTVDESVAVGKCEGEQPAPGDEATLVNP